MRTYLPLSRKATIRAETMTVREVSTVSSEAKNLPNHSTAPRRIRHLELCSSSSRRSNSLPLRASFSTGEEAVVSFLSFSFSTLSLAESKPFSEAVHVLRLALSRRRSFLRDSHRGAIKMSAVPTDIKPALTIIFTKDKSPPKIPPIRRPPP